MHYLIQYSSPLVQIEYLICAVVLIFYTIRKWTRTGVIFSPFNFQIWFFAFTMMIISPYQYNYELANTWTTFPPEEYIASLNECYTVNLFGFIIMILCMNYLERKRDNNQLFERTFAAVSKNLSNTLLNMLCIVLPALFVAFIYIKANGIPVLNGNRDFAQDLNQPVFLLFQAITYLLAWYYTGNFYKGKIQLGQILVLIYLIFSLLLTANRTFPLKIIYAVLLILLFTRHAVNWGSIFRQIRYVLVILVLGIVIFLTRSSEAAGSARTVLTDSVMYGSTFSDMRDGARILWGYHSMYSSPLWGRTYLASILSFIPSSLDDPSMPLLSSIANFRVEYGGGSWSTLTLFGIENHYGLRGGMFTTSYVNFGVLGVVIVAIALAYWFSNCEILFVKLIKYPDLANPRNIMFAYCVLAIFSEFLYAPSGFNSVWGFLIVLVISKFRIDSVRE